jgi:hypothetical protein
MYVNTWTVSSDVWCERGCHYVGENLTGVKHSATFCFVARTATKFTINRRYIQTHTHTHTHTHTYIHTYIHTRIHTKSKGEAVPVLN